MCLHVPACTHLLINSQQGKPICNPHGKNSIYQDIYLRLLLLSLSTIYLNQKIYMYQLRSIFMRYAAFACFIRMINPEVSYQAEMWLLRSLQFVSLCIYNMAYR